MRRGAKIWLGLLLLLLPIARRAAEAMDCKDLVQRSVMLRCSGLQRVRRSAPLEFAGLEPPANDFASVINEKQVRKRQIILSAPSYARYQSVPIVPPSVASTNQKFDYLPQENGRNVGYQINEQEIIDVFNELYGRLRRSSPGRTREQELSDFIPKAYECCKNPQLCLDKGGPIDNCPF